MDNLNLTLSSKPCPACGYHVTVPFYNGRYQTLATLAWPATADAAVGMKRLPLNFVCCIECGHIFNMAFDYAEVPYSDKPNLMYNKGAIWAGFIADLQREMATALPGQPTVVEIGHGDGSFISSLAGLKPGGRFIGFDPHGARHAGDGVELRNALFDPLTHIPQLRPDLIISRHVLEHLTNPLGFLQVIAFASTLCDLSPLAYIEVPCVDRALETGRTVDFYYEHNSHFTTGSFSQMLARCNVAVERIGHGYDGEIIFGFARVGAHERHARQATAAATFFWEAQASRHGILTQLAAFHAEGRKVAVWGGTGKSASFMQRYEVDAVRFPVVVDSDQAKVGTFVPGTGQEIRFRDYLLDHPHEIVIVPPQWRAADIVTEMRRCGIAAAEVLIEHQGRLIDFLRGTHPYRKPLEKAAA